MAACLVSILCLSFIFFLVLDQLCILYSRSLSKLKSPRLTSRGTKLNSREGEVLYYISNVHSYSFWVFVCSLFMDLISKIVYRGKD